MKRIALLSSIPALIFAVLAVSHAPNAISAERCSAKQCHQKLLNVKYVHPGTETCDMCHQKVIKQHPQRNKKSFQLTQEPASLCAQCHPAMATLTFVHAPVGTGMCTACHNIHAGERKLLSRPAKDLCSLCHKDKINFQFMHGPAATGDCASCHSPHDSNNKQLLVKDGQDLCFSCHIDMEKKIKKPFMHAALEGGCTSCHNPHGSSAKMFFPAPGPALCYQCHPDMETKIMAAKSVHPPIKSDQGCASCHAPHSADTKKLLPKTGKDLCLDCHKGFLKKNYTVLHGPIKEGKCEACHDPHGTASSKLLSKAYSTENYIKYNENEYQFCFSCHSRDALRNETTSYATGFRDGEQNLHYLHVSREKGRNCKLCHVIHGGELPKLLADSVPFGKWNLPLRFIKTDTGGSCAPGCHKKYSYDRTNPEKTRQPVKPAKKEKAKKNTGRR
jgi:predicted CXXCH cytochrome family protein